MDSKKIIQLLGSIFVMVIFVVSYFAFGNYNPTSKQTATTPVQTYPEIGYANATVIGYGNTATISIVCNLNSTSSIVSDLLNGLERNGSINNYYSPETNATIVYLGKIDPPNLSIYLKSNLNESTFNCISLSASTKLQLPQIIYLGSGLQKYPILLPNSTRIMNFELPISNKITIKLRILALVTDNMSVNNLTARVV
ncbi:MAG: hypothetical protein ACP5RT_02245 [Candidatus Micrarchaeia archaeon]